MKVLQVSESDNIGGAAIASTRLNSLLNSFDIESELLVSRKKSSGANIIAPISIFDRIYAKVIPHLIIRYNKWKFGTLKLTTSTNRSSFFFLKIIKKQKFDILHLHWVNNGFVGLDDLNSITKPIVWTLHDNWLFTGACHSTQGCVEFKDRCEVCPCIHLKRKQVNLNYQFLEKKTKLQKLKDKIVIVVPSQWMLESAKKSKILEGYDINVIPNFIDVDLFIPKDKAISKESLNLSQKKKYILFGATDPINDSNKGFDYIQQMAIRGVLDGYTLLIFGKISNVEKINLDIEFILMGSIYDQNKLVLLYNVAELVIMPSIHESFGQVAAEAMSCGIPVLCFNTTGLRDIVDHKKGGYLAKLKDIDDLIIGFKWIISQDNLNNLARLKIEKEFSKEVIYNKYVLLYEDLIKKKG